MPGIFNAFGRMIFAAFGVGCAQLQKSRLSAVCRAGSTLRSLGRFKNRCQLIRRHKTHRLTLPSHISRRSRRPKRKVVARDGFGAFNVTEPFKRPSIQSAFLPAFFHGICREGQPGLQPTFGKSRLHSAELIGRVDQPDTPIGFNDDKAARSALIRCRERRLRYGRQFMRKAHPIQAFKRRMRECNAVKHGWKKHRIGYGESSCCPRIAPSRDMTRSCRTRHGDGFAVFIKLRMKNRHRCFFSLSPLLSGRPSCGDG